VLLNDYEDAFLLKNSSWNFLNRTNFLRIFILSFLSLYIMITPPIIIIIIIIIVDLFEIILYWFYYLDSIVCRLLILFVFICKLNDFNAHARSRAKFLLCSARFFKLQEYIRI